MLFGALALGIGFFAGLDVAHSRADTVAAGAPEGVDFTPVWKAWQVIDEKFVPVAVSTSTASTTTDSDQERVWGMIQGLAGSLGDPYTFFLPPSETQQFNDDMSGRFEGVGMEIAVRDQVLMVVAPLKGTPAERAGIRAGDHILKIDDTTTRDMDVNEAVQLIRGPKGSTVTLTIQRNGEGEERVIEVTRDVINVPIITTEQKGDVFVISVATFTANSPNLFRDALREFVNSGKTKLVLDLRGNPGGYLDAAVDMASWFLPSGRVVVTEDYAGHARNIVHRSSGYDIFNDNLRMVILVDRGSASASEILADALQYYGDATLVGTRTFGKGSVQELVSITEDTSLKITVARWVGPDGEPIPLEGIEPDVEVKMTEEDFEEDRDPQMDKAIELLNQ
jgi:carboxyl-terminal processing protease